MTPAEFNVLAERANATMRVHDVEALQQAVKLLRKGTSIGVYSKEPAYRAPSWAGGGYHPERERTIPAVLVSFDGDMHVSACDTDEAHRLRCGAAAKSTPKRTIDVYLYNLRALPGTRFKGSSRRR